MINLSILKISKIFFNNENRTHSNEIRDNKMLHYSHAERKRRRVTVMNIFRKWLEENKVEKPFQVIANNDEDEEIAKQLTILLNISEEEE